MTTAEAPVELPIDVLVAIPAHDEADAIGGCLEAAVAALAEAQRRGVVARARVAVAAHRCADDTRDRALDRLTGLSGIESVVVDDPRDLAVGAVRTGLIRYAINLPEPLSSDCWILSTDADTIVPSDWATGLLTAARESRADLVLGLADLQDWSVDDSARRVYDELIEAGIRGEQHDHVYAANLAVSWPAFAAVDGFPGVAHGEEHALVRAVRSSGRCVVSPLTPRVATSARMPGRAAAGLGNLLARIAADTVDDRDARDSAPA